jgi:hypothetical protein
MSRCPIAAVLLVCALFALEAPAQQAPKFEPPSAGELAELEGSKSPQLREVRGGNAQFGRPLSAREQRILDKLAKAHPEAYERLKELRGGRVSVYVSWWDDWGMFLIIPGASCTATLLVVLLLLLLIW